MSLDATIAAVREAFGRVAWTHKTHEKAIDRLNQRAKYLKLANVVLLVLTTGGTLTSVFGKNAYVETATAALATAALSLAVYQLSFDPTKDIVEHRKAAKRLWHIRERYIHLLCDVDAGVLTEEEVRRQRDSFADELAALYAEAPDTTSADYNAASKALKVNQELTFTDDEIDQFLPKDLRKRKS